MSIKKIKMIKDTIVKPIYQLYKVLDVTSLPEEVYNKFKENSNWSDNYEEYKWNSELLDTWLVSNKIVKNEKLLIKYN